MALWAGYAVRTSPAANPNTGLLSYALLAYGYACHETDPFDALEALRRGMMIARDSGNRASETHLALGLCRLEAGHGDPLAALEYATRAIRSYHDSGNTTQLRTALAWLAAYFDRLGHPEPGATIAGFAFDPSNPLTTAWIPELDSAITHLRDVLGDQTYESLARRGEAMATAAIATYAFDQIDRARTAIEQLA